MNTPRTDTHRLVSLIDELENLLIAAPSSEFKQAARKSGAVADVQAIVHRQIAKVDMRPIPASSRIDRADQLAAVQSLFQSRVALPSHIRAVFGKGSSASDQEIDAMIDELISRGLINSTDKKKRS